jgi:predicted ATPase/class 3 adenylate cyclase
MIRMRGGYGIGGGILTDGAARATGRAPTATVVESVTSTSVRSTSMVKGLPSGTVTFLFTDIEASTGIVRELGERYSDLLDHHHRLLRAVWRRHRGVEVSTDGDAFFVAFAGASDAVAATIDAQRTLAAATWPTEHPVRVRMGLHAGHARPVDDDYRALAVHQAARVVDASNGGQVLATAEVMALSRDTPPDLVVTDLGRYRVRDFDEPITLYRLSAADLDGDTRSPRVRPADRHNLVRPVTSMVNRVVEQAEVPELVRPGALVTLLGPGGAGKTRLSIEVGLQVFDRWPDGVWFVDLSPVSEGEVVPMLIAAAVSAPSVRGNDALSDVVAHLADRSALLVLDNCEHVVEPISRLVGDLLRRCPHVGVLATSRVPLGLIGERLYRLEPLRTDDVDSDAVRLFVERSGLAGDVDLSDVVTLCRAIDGLPLAIELAATRSHLLTPAEMTDRMRTGVGVVSTRDRTVPERQRSLDRLLDWSLDLLNPDELLALSRLAVLADGFDLSLAEATAADETVPASRVPELVWSLIDWSLVVREVAAGSSRYSLFSTVRSYVLERADAEDTAATRRRVAEVLLDRLGPRRSSSSEWCTQFDIDLENVRAVVAHPDISGPVARSLAWSIGQYHDVRASFRSAIEEISRCVAQRPSPGPDLVALLTLQADAHLRLGEVDQAGRIVERAAALAAEVGVPDWDDMCVARTKGEVALRSNDPITAARLAEEALSDASATPRGQARMWNLAALARYALGDLSGAAQALDHGLTAETEAGLETFLVNTHGNYAEMLLELGDTAGAAGHQLEALELGRSTGQPHTVAFSFMVAARFALEEGAAADAVRLQSAADGIIARQGYSLYAADEQVRTALLAAARGALGAADFDQARAAGESIPVDQLADQTEAILRRRAAMSSTPGG